MTLHELIKMMPWQMCAVVKAKGGPMKYLSVTVFGSGSVTG